MYNEISRKCSDCQSHRGAQTMLVHRVLTRLVSEARAQWPKWHTQPQTVGADNGATRLTPEISEPKGGMGGLAAEHRRSTAFSLLLTVTKTHASKSKPHPEAYKGPGPSAGHPIRGWGRLLPPAFDQHSGQGVDDVRRNTHRARRKRKEHSVCNKLTRESV